MGVVLSRTEPGPFGEKFTHPRYNEYYVSLHAKHNCRHCYGRGKLNFDNPTTGVKTVIACDCVFRK